MLHSLLTLFSSERSAFSFRTSQTIKKLQTEHVCNDQTRDHMRSTIETAVCLLDLENTCHKLAKKNSSKQVSPRAQIFLLRTRVDL